MAAGPIKPVEAVHSIDPIVKNLQQRGYSVETQQLFDKLQQRGYSVETQQRLVSMESKDGRKVKLPVQEMRIRYTGDRVY